MRNFLAAIMCFVIAIIVPLKLMLDFQNFKKNAIETQAIVSNIEIVKSKGSRGITITTKDVHYEFQTEDTKKIKSNNTLLFSKLEKGDPIDIYYDKSNPTSTEIKGFKLLFSSLVFLFFTAFGLVIIILGRRRVGRRF